MMDAVNAGWSLPEVLQQLALGGDHEAVAELIALFKQDAASRLQVWRGAVLRGDLGVAGTPAHTIKRSAIQIGAMNLVTSCRHMEKLDAAHHNLEGRAACPVRSL
jgi:HPt (histidine-containing phosphotransfer) domain-containing protein